MFPDSAVLYALISSNVIVLTWVAQTLWQLDRRLLVLEIKAGVKKEKA